MTITWAESETNRLLLEIARGRHREQVRESLAKIRFNELLKSAPRINIPLRMQPDIESITCNNPLCAVLGVNGWLRRHMDIQNIYYGGQDKYGRGGRARFQSLEDDLFQMDEIENGSAPTGYQKSLKKSYQRVDNRNNSFKGRSMKDYWKEIDPEMEDIPFEEIP